MLKEVFFEGVRTMCDTGVRWHKARFPNLNKVKLSESRVCLEGFRAEEVDAPPYETDSKKEKD